MRITVVGTYETSVGEYKLARRWLGVGITTKMHDDDLFLIPQKVFEDFPVVFAPQGTESEVVEFDDDKLEPYSLPPTAETTAAIRAGRLIKFILRQFYSRLEESYVPFVQFAKNEGIVAAMEVYQALTKKPAMGARLFGMYHYQYISNGELRFADGTIYLYKRILTHYPEQGITCCQWKLGDDEVDTVMTYDNRGRFGKMIVDPVMTMDLHRHFVKEPVVKLQDYIDAETDNYVGSAIKTFYALRHLEAQRRFDLQDLRSKLRK